MADGRLGVISQPEHPNAMSFSDKVVVITGAARGIGFALAEAFSGRGATLVLTDIDERVGAQSASTLGAHFETLDVRDADSAKKVIAKIAERYGTIDIWINNAGVANHRPTVDVEPDEWEHAIGVMLSGAFFCARQVGLIMINQGGGCVINIASVNGLLAQKGRASYCSAKAGLIMLTKVLASEWGEHGIRVNAVAPGIVKTDLAMHGIKRGIVNERDYLDRTPMGRWGELSEIIEPILFLANDDESSFVNGEVLQVDGGWTAYHLFHPLEESLKV